jgi:hypothetical protein
MHATTVAIDLAKGVFELAFADPGGRNLERKRLTRFSMPEQPPAADGGDGDLRHQARPQAPGD